MKSLFAKISATTLGLIFVFVLSVTYSWLVAIVPFIYVTVFLTVGLAVALTFVIYLMAYFGHYHTRRQRILLSVGAVFAAEFWQWLSYVAFLILGKESIFNVGFYFDILLRPNDFLIPVLHEVYAVGAFSIGDTPIYGFPLLVFWTMEFLILLMIPLKFILASHFPPYALASGAWFPKYSFKEYWNSFPTKADLENAFLENNVEFLAAHGKGYINNHSTFAIYYHPMSQIAYITVWNNRVSKQTGKIDKRLLLENYSVKAGFAKALLDSYPSKKRWFSLEGLTFV